MFTPINQGIFDQWRRFLIDAELARNYDVPYRLYAHEHLPVPKNPMLERLLPSLLYLQLCAILDDALKMYLQLNKVKGPKNDTLEARISFFGKERYLQNAQELQALRKVRNGIAHTIDRSATWEAFEEATSCVEKALQQLGFVDDRPGISVYGVSAGGTPEPPDPSIKRRDVYSWGLRIDGKKVKGFSWQVNIPRDSSDT